MNINDLSVNISHLDSSQLLEDWYWLIGEAMQPVLVTLTGDAFLQDNKSGSVHFLDTVEGSITQIAEDGESFKQLLTQADFVMDHFSVNLVAPKIKVGEIPGTGKIFSFRKAPCLGGDYSTENLEPTDISVHFSLTGQIWQKVKHLPDGASIDSISIS